MVEIQQSFYLTKIVDRVVKCKIQIKMLQQDHMLKILKLNLSKYSKQWLIYHLKIQKKQKVLDTAPMFLKFRPKISEQFNTNHVTTCLSHPIDRIQTYIKTR
jgi:hypothetical protein